MLPCSQPNDSRYCFTVAWNDVAASLVRKYQLVYYISSAKAFQSLSLQKLGPQFCKDLERHMEAHGGAAAHSGGGIGREAKTPLTQLPAPATGELRPRTASCGEGNWLRRGQRAATRAASWKSALTSSRGSTTACRRRLKCPATKYPRIIK